MELIMIISFDVELEIADKTLPIIWDRPNSPGVKTPQYHKTLMQSMDYVDEIKGIILPAIIPEQLEYDIIKMLDHIRLLNDKKLNRVPVSVVNCTTNISDLIIERDDGVEPFQDNNIDIFPSESLSNINLQKIIGVIGNDKPFAEHHGLANEWGQYRLLSQLNLNGEFDVDLNEIRQNLSEVRYFKKLLLNEKKESPINGIDDRFKLLLNNLRDKKLNVAIIDDKVKNGWDKAYGAIFQNSDVISFDESENNKFDTKTSSDFDLIILDLRLEEEVTHDDSEIFGIEEISGIKLLIEIKKCDPSVPVIICTASNKSWSYDAAINAGADGFWTKESPDFGMSLDYRFNNTLDLLNTIDKVLKWSADIRPMYRAMSEIADDVNEINVPVGKSISVKTKIVFSQLHSQRSKFIENHYGQSGLTTAYLAICSLVNDAVSFFRRKVDENFSLIVGEHEYEFCELLGTDKDKQFIICDDVIDLIKIEKTEINKGYNPIKVNYLFPEKQFMNFLLEKSDLGKYRGRYGFLSKIRNHLDIIHSKPISEEFDVAVGDFQNADLPKLELIHLYQMLEIFYVLFTGKSIKI